MIGFELLKSSGGIYISNAIYWVCQENGKLYCKCLLHHSDGSVLFENANYYANIAYV